MSELLIGRGKVARIYKVEESAEALIRKEFSPIYHVKLWNWFFFHSPHPLSTETGYRYAYWKRRLAHRLCKVFMSDINIPDAICLTDRGFVSEFVKGEVPVKDDWDNLSVMVRRLEFYFDAIGMPTWSFSWKNPFSVSNFVSSNGRLHIVDYEQSVPILNTQGVIDYDVIRFKPLEEFIRSNRQKIASVLGNQESRLLREALEKTKEYHAKLDIRPKKFTRLLNKSVSKRINAKKKLVRVVL